MLKIVILGSAMGYVDMDMNLGKLGDMLRDREAWRAAVHGVTKSWTRLGDLNNGNLFLLVLISRMSKVKVPAR